MKKQLGAECFFEAIRIMTEMREETNGQYPRFAVWENVPGAFSSGGGRDFLAVLQAIAAIAEPGVSIPEPERDSKTDNLIWFSAGSIVGNGWSIAWRTLDAQYWGVPQRRKRIYLVADFGSERAADILLERYSLRGNIAESGEARKRIAEDATGCADGSIGVECLNPLFFDAYNQLSGDVSKTLNTGSDYDKTGCVVQPVIALQANGIDRADTAGCNGAGWRENEMYTLNTVDRHAVCYPLNEQIILRHGALGKNTGFGAGDDGDPAYTLQANHPHMVCYQESVGALQASDYKWVQQQQVEQGKLIVTNRDKDKRYIVRRLMPIETTRLQGYPDFWHHLAPFDGDVEFWESVRKTWARINGTTYKPFKDIARLEKWYYKLRNDGAEYKADGNSLAIPCAEYVIRRIAETVLEESNQNIDKQQ